MRIKELLQEVYDPSQWIEDNWDTHNYSKVHDEDSRIEIMSDGKICAKDNIHLDLDGNELPFEFVDTDFNFTLRNPRSLKGCPKKVGGYFRIHDGTNVSLEHAPEEIGFKRDSNNDVLPALFDVYSLKGINRYIKKINGAIEVGWSLKENVLGVFKIQGVTGVHSEYRGRVDSPEKLEKVLSIITRNIKSGNAGLIKAQRELIDNCFDDFADM